MQLSAFQAALRSHASAPVRFLLPDGSLIPVQFHITEVGHVAKRFIDCGGTVRSVETCQLQAWVAGDDDAHRLPAGKLADILTKARVVLPSDQLEVEVEYERDSAAQYRVESFTADAGRLTFTLAGKATACLAREAGGLEPAGCGCGETSGRCC